ncbi:MAG: protein phosphatase 2C domain-containing protein [bacterium]|nr:protein phosphatase 2C domain-containing protein [bacterium]
MKFHTDDHFVIGADHVSQGKPCQDYALSGLHGDMAYAVVSDGCSSGGLTDVGSRLMSLSTVAAMRELWSTAGRMQNDAAEEIDLRQRIILGGVKETLRITRNDMLATCAFIYMTPQGGIIHLRGDGVLAIVGRDGHIGLYRFDWANNRPFYPAYIDDNYQSFIKAHGADVSVKALTSEVWVMRPDEEHVATLTHSIEDGIKGITLKISVNDLAYVAVFTDGVTQVDGMDWKRSTADLLAFKSIEGVFAKRRMNAFIKSSQKIGRGPLDDIAMAVVRVEHGIEEKK